MNPYFICSLPRSRTAWLANFLSYGPSHCFHEPFNEYTIADLPGLFGSVQRDYVGVSDSINTLIVGDILKVFPTAKLILVRRPAKEVNESLSRIGIFCEDFISHLDSELDHLAVVFQPLILDFHHFDAAGAWNYLMPEVPFNRERTRMLENFNVTVPKEIIMQKAEGIIRKCAQLMPEMFGGVKGN